MRKQVILRLDEGLLAQVDWARGDVPRQRWLVRAIEKALGEGAPDPGRSVGQDAVQREPSPAPPQVSVPSHPLSEKEKQGIRNIAGVVRASSLKTCSECGSAGRVHQRGCSKA